MQLPKLTPLQSRFMACLGTLFLLVALYYTLNPSIFAYAAEVPLKADLQEDHNHHRIHGSSADLAPDVGWEERLEAFDVDTPSDNGEWDGETAGYQADFFGADRSLIGRASEDQIALTDSIPFELNIQAGETSYYVFQNSSVWASIPPDNGDDSDDDPSDIGNEPSDIGDDPGAMIVRRHLGLEVEKILQDTIVEDSAEDDESLDGASANDSADAPLKKRQTSTPTRLVYITVNTCLQPQLNGTNGPLPQLALFVSTTDNNQQPGPNSKGQQDEVPLVQGYASATFEAAGNVYIGVSAPASEGSATWNYAVSASIRQPTFQFSPSATFLKLLDTDAGSVLLSTGNLTTQNASSSAKQSLMNMKSPFSLYIFNQSDARIEGLKKSWCGLQKLSSGFSVNGTMTMRGFAAIPKEQFYAQGLQPGSKYTAMLTYTGQNVSQVWASKNFQTKSDNNCKLVYDLPFCDNVAWSVPWNGSLSAATLGKLYDDNAAFIYENFSASLQQVACNTTSSAQYSLIRNCDDCARDYRNWLCAVTVPRCTDLSNPASFLVPRGVGSKFSNGSSPDLSAVGLNSTMLNVNRFNSSRSPFIDQTVVAQPYKEVLPCGDLCYELVKSCPASLGFACPKPEWMMQRSYGTLEMGQLASGVQTCNYPGLDVPDPGNAAAAVVVSRLALCAVAMSMLVMMLW